MKRRQLGVLTACICLMLSACGKTSDTSESEASTGTSSEVLQDDSSNTVTTINASQYDNGDPVATSNSSTAEMVITNSTTSTISKTDSSTNTKEYELILESYFEATANDDREKILEIMYPKRVIEGFREYGIVEQMLSENLNMNVDSSLKTYEITEIIEEGALQQDELALGMKNYDQMIAVFEKLKEWGCGLDALTDAQKTEMAQLLEDPSNTPSVYTASKGYDVTVFYNKDGKPDEDYFYVYYIDGEGWKLNNSMRKFVQKSKETSALSCAKSVYNAYTMALFELDESGVNLKGTYIIGSDDKMNCNVPSSINVSELRKEVQENIGTASDDNSFIIVQDGICVYAATDHNSICGTYPPNSIPKMNGQKVETEEVARLNSYSLDSLFEIAKKILC